VILIDKSSSPALVYDLDSTLSFPISAVDYLQLAIRDETNIIRKYRRYTSEYHLSFNIFLCLYLGCFE
jgi:hypothetical protein